MRADRRRLAALTLAAVALLAGCGQREDVLPGPRFDLRQLDAASEAVEQLSPQEAAGVFAEPAPQPPTRLPLVDYAVSGAARALALPAARVNAEWTHTGGSPQHTIPNPALGTALQPAWSAQIGAGNTRRMRLSADPVVAGGRVLTLDTLSEVRAFSAATGGLAWQRNLTPAAETPGQAVGGGIAAAAGRVFVTTGFGNLHALDLATGAELWVQRLGANPAAAPTAVDGLVYITSRDGVAWALDAENGRILWRIEGGDPGAVTLTGASPVVAGGTVVFPFGNGDLVAALRRGGIRVWSTTIGGQRLGRAYAGFGDVAGGPVVAGNRLYGANPAGRLAALDVESGTRLWTATDGALSPVVPAGDSVFLITDENELKRLEAATGAEIWSATLPLFTRERIARRSGVFAHYGPLLAGGRLLVASSDGVLREIDPRSGQLLRATELPAPAASNPVVAGGTLYLVTANGQLHALR